jgi:hypothetical protein
LKTIVPLYCAIQKFNLKKTIAKMQKATLEGVAFCDGAAI